MPRRVASLLLVVLALAACGGAEEPVPRGAEAPGEPVLAAAATATEAAGSYRADLELTMDGLAPEPVTLTGAGVFQRDPTLAQMTMDTSELGGIAGGLDLGDVEMVMDGLVVYVRVPFLQEISPALGPWISLDLREAGAQQGLDVAHLTQFGAQSDPARALAYLRAASDDLETVGTEAVRGIETTHYRMTVDLARVAEAAPSAERDALRAQMERLQELSGVEQVPTEVWVDGDGLVRRQTLTYQDMRFAPGQEGDMTMTMELYDFGADVDVEPPPADDVTDIGALLGRG